MSKLVDKKDLTRWNRAGLRRFRYVDGNAITYLETLRQAMRNAFDDGSGQPTWQALDTAIAVPPVESAAERQARWVQQYHDERRDYGWEILRSYARSTHVLTEHLNAYANEGYLRTATQWSSVRRLVEMLDYHPAPPASASAPIALIAKDARAGTVETGFAVKNAPQDGSSPVIFETLEDLEVDAALNALHLRQWDQSQRQFEIASDGTCEFPLAAGAEASEGAAGVLAAEALDGMGDAAGVAATVSGVIAGGDRALSLRVGAAPSGLPAPLTHARARLLLEPRFKRTPRLSGEGVLSIAPTGEAGHGLTPGAVVAWRSPHGIWHALRVDAVDGDRVRLAGPASLPSTDDLLYLAVAAAPGGAEGEHVAIVPPSRLTPGVWTDSLYWYRDEWLDTRTHNDAAGDEFTAYRYVDTSAPVHYLPTGSVPVATVESTDPQALEFDGSPDKLASGDWALVDVDGIHHAVRITSIEEGERSFKLMLSRAFERVSAVYANFATELRPRDHDINTTAAFLTAPESRSPSHSVLPLQLDGVPEALRAGRRLILAAGDEAMAVTVKRVEAAAHGANVTVAPALPGSEPGADAGATPYTRHRTLVYANVVPAGHGQTQSERVLTSGEATASGQSANLDTNNVSFVGGSEFPAGVRAAVVVRVGERTWQQVPSLNDSAPEAPDYVVRMNEDGTLEFQFGDGRRGRRLPSGENNVRITARVGTGLAGNLEPYSLTKPVKPHYLLDAVVQPVATRGGNDMEGVESMRENAPAAVLTLGRAVSLADYTHLAASNSSVWQARAFRVPPGMGRSEHVKVAVVPAGGGELGTLKPSLEQYLSRHAPPGVKVSVVAFDSLLLDAEVELGVRTDQYDPDMVRRGVREALLGAFALRVSPLGQPLFRSRVFQVIESVEGVANAQCRINPDGFRNAAGEERRPHPVRGSDGHIKRVSPAPDQVIYADRELSNLTITARDFTG